MHELLNQKVIYFFTFVFTFKQVKNHAKKKKSIYYILRELHICPLWWTPCIKGVKSESIELNVWFLKYLLRENGLNIHKNIQ